MSQFAAAFAVAGGVWVAYHQLRATRQAVSSARRSQLAEEMLVLCARVENAFKHMRNPLDSIPQDEVGDREKLYRRRYERVYEANEVFSDLLEHQVRLDAVLGYDATKADVNFLLQARTEIAFAIEELADMEREGDRLHRSEDWQKERRVLYGTWSERDEFGAEILARIEQVRSVAKKYATFGVTQ